MEWHRKDTKMTNAQIIKNIRKKLNKISGLLSEIDEEFKKIDPEKPLATKRKQPRRLKKQIPMPSLEEFKQIYMELYSQFTKNNPGVVEEFVKAHTKDYLNAFCKANSLPIKAKESKGKIAKQIGQWFAQKKAITK